MTCRNASHSSNWTTSREALDAYVAHASIVISVTVVAVVTLRREQGSQLPVS